MGEALGEGGGLMSSGPSKAAESLVTFFLPPACREEVLGDLAQLVLGDLAVTEQ